MFWAPPALAMLNIESNVQFGLNSSYISVPLLFDATPMQFEPVSGFLVLANISDAWLVNNTQLMSNNSISWILADFFTPARRPYLEAKLGFWAKQRYPPKAIIIFGGTIKSHFIIIFVQIRIDIFL